MPEITVTVTAKSAEYLDQLLKSGLYGEDRAGAAERLIAQALAILIRDGTVRTSGGLLGLRREPEERRNAEHSTTARQPT